MTKNNKKKYNFFFVVVNLLNFNIENVPFIEIFDIKQICVATILYYYLHHIQQYMVYLNLDAIK